MKVKIKKLHSQAKIPKYALDGDAGMDLTATYKERNGNYGYIEYGTGLSIEIPKGYVGLLFPRSSISRTYHSLSNSVGIIDSNYRGEITFRFFPTAVNLIDCLDAIDILNVKQQAYNDEYEVGDRIGQLIIIPYPQIEFEEVEELSKTERGEGGYGSTGK